VTHLIPEIEALLIVIVAAPLSWGVAVWLWRLARSSPKLKVLRANAIAATALAIIVSVFAAIFVNNELTPPPLDNIATQIITRTTLLVCSLVSAAYWIRLYRAK
jgi:ABC-type phosphate/phosphonate transport system permease subunit